MATAKATDSILRKSEMRFIIGCEYSHWMTTGAKFSLNMN